MKQQKSDLSQANDDGPPYQLTCVTGEFVFMLASFNPMLGGKGTKLRASKASLEFDGRFATVVCPGHAVSFNASGVWPGRATFSLNLIRAMLLSPPSSDALLIRTDTRRLTIGTTGVECSWQKAIIEDGDNYFSLPEPTDHLHMLQMLERYGRSPLYQQGFQRHLRSAKAWRLRRIHSALEHLADLGVTFDDLAHLVDEAIQREVRKRERP